ncbi:hypothetical protein ISG33_14580 [Glaciecola sp. MH2013]|uniref:hypothetical protein n=1 Tax=Glaciecola sp. MH2013 TaxID=2785524 RepID=UPI00189E6ABA|nr:hypothetical protein [Glaciecola sp. MH2013]MBF7074629.1 hypothetical protein [Glaciecola sp. MH2013]
MLGWLNDANPNEDAMNAIKSGDIRFYAFKLHHRYSVPVYESFCPDWRKLSANREQVLSNVRLIDGAGYSPNYTISYEYRKFSAIALLYIKEYNSRIYFEMEEDGSFKCDT